MTACRSCACGCCGGIHSATPLLVSNRPGLSAIAYRCGTHSSWKLSMLAALSGTENGKTKALSGRLTTRDDDDFSIALLDAWATVADVLSFYQERIANESFLRTARERLSLVELSRLIGYEPAPAAAAETWLAFSIDGEATKETVTIDAGTRVQSVPGQDEQPQSFETSDALKARAEWNAVDVRPAVDAHITNTATYVGGTATNLKKGDPLLFSAGAAFELRLVARAAPDFDNKRTYVEWQPPLTIAATAVSAMRVTAPLFAHNAPQPAILPSGVPGLLESGTTISSSDWKYPISGATIDLDGAHPEVQKDGAVVLTKPGGTPRRFFVKAATVISRTHYTVSGKATRTVLTSSSHLNEFAKSNYRVTLAYAGEENLPLAEWPRGAVTGQTIELATKITPFTGGREVVITGPEAGTGNLLAVPAVGTVTNSGSHSTLSLDAPLTQAFDPTRTKVFANVVSASHGETVKQVLGSGDATRAFQRFPLSRAPLTYLSSSESPRGVKSTLSTVVNDLRWREVPTLFDTSPRDRIYRTARDADEKTAVLFGDGRDQGPRLPSGQDNVRAVYRVGAGRGGNVRAGQLSLLMTRPFGVKDVINPLQAEGGVDAEPFADVRRNAPRTVLTLDRVVSLSDYQSFATTFKGIGKALATWTWLGTSREVLLSVAGAAGEAISASSPLRKDLLGALRRFGKSYVAVRIESYQPVWFRIKARVKTDPDAVADGVMAGVRQALETAFSFDARAFGQAISLSEVESVIQGVNGVVFVDVDALYRTGFPPPPSGRLVPKEPLIKPDGSLQAAEILMLDQWQALDIHPMEIS